MDRPVTFERIADPGRLDAVRAIAASVWPPTFAPILPPAQIPYMMCMMYAPEVLRAELSAGVRWELALLDGIPVGYLSWSAHPSRPGTAKLHKVYLLAEHHGRGIGQAMLDRAAACCRDEGYSAVLLAVNKRNERAIRAYLRNGFRIAEASVTDIGSGFVMDDWLMLKDLP